jgi:threonine 3-dehydrogenase
MIFKNLTVAAVNGRDIWGTWFRTRWLLEHGVVDLRPLITERMPLSEFDRAFALLESGEACKIVLHPDAASHEPVFATPDEVADSDLVLPMQQWAHR